MGIALIGCGKISRKHVHVLSGIDGLRLRVACDADPVRAQRVAGDVEGCRPLTSLEDALARPEVDVVSICTPSGLHAPMAIAAARAGKHVIVEKPMALRLDEADRMMEACDANGVRLFVVKQNRCNRPIVKLKEAIVSGRLGRPFLGGVRVLWQRDQEYYDSEPWRGTWRMDGGVIMNQASHHVDLLIWLMGDVTSVLASGRTVAHEIETEDTAVAILKFRGGGMATIQATTCVQPRDLEGSLSVFGERGMAEVGGFAADRLRVWEFREDDEWHADVRANWSANPKDVFAYNHKEFYKNVVESLRGGGRALIDGIEGRKTLEVIHAIYESFETGREVALRFQPQWCRLGVDPEEGGARVPGPRGGWL
ncbi:MAG: gfo/Idh/MocA family oxidoreductase [Candidatus Eisenbacteria bacterium]|nr:gfo/Idh/MocA family oxidoreductase [Candidatus Eisenbacteria bacterium]